MATTRKRAPRKTAPKAKEQITEARFFGTESKIEFILEWNKGCQFDALEAGLDPENSDMMNATICIWAAIKNKPANYSLRDCFIDLPEDDDEQAELFNAVRALRENASKR